MEYPNMVFLLVRAYKFECFIEGNNLQFSAKKELDGYRKSVLIRYSKDYHKFYDLNTGYEMTFIDFDDLNIDVYDHEIYINYGEDNPMYLFKPEISDIKKANFLYEKYKSEDKLIDENKLIRFKGRLVYEKDSYY